MVSKPTTAGESEKLHTDAPPIATRAPEPLRASNVVKQFGQLRAVDAVSLDIQPGEIFALLGPNGAGKTTLIHCITGLARQSAGEISVFGYDTLREFHHTRRLVGLVPQEINFDPFFTPFESLLIQMGLMGVRQDPRWAERLLELFALSGHRDAYTRNLSGGMKRRLLVAKALVHRPKLLFLDEPTAGVDVELRKDLWDEVLKLRDEGTTIILTTHYLEEAEQLADRIGVIHKGRIVLVENRDALMRRYGQQRLRVTLTEDIAELPSGFPEGTEQLGRNQLLVPWSHPNELPPCFDALRACAGLKSVSFEETRLEDIFVDLIARAEKQEL